MENKTILIIFHPDTLELEIEAPELPMDFAMSMLERAKRALENQEKIALAQLMRHSAAEQERTEKVISRIKM